MRSSGSTSSIVTSPPVAAARAAKLATSMCSGPIRYSPPSELVDAFDVEDVRADALDVRAERDEKATEILDVRLAGRVPDARLPVGEHGSHDRVLRPHDGRLVEVEPLAAEPVGSHLVGAVELDVDAELLERVDVRVEPPATDDVAARRRNRHSTEAREQRAGEEERRADLASEVGVEIGSRHPTRVDPDVVRTGPLDVGAELGEQLDHRLDVSDPWDVREPHLAGGEHAGGQNRKRAVLVARRTHRAAQRPPALDDEGLHRAGNATRGLHGTPRIRRLTTSSLGIEPAGSKPRTCA